MRLLSLLVVLVCGSQVMAQTDASFAVEGRITDAYTQEPIPFVNIYNHSLHQGTLSNEDGYFRLIVSGIHDSISIRSVGYKNITPDFSNPSAFEVIALEPNARVLEEVVIQPEDTRYLFNLLRDCSKLAQKKHASGKAYYQLRSFRDSTQVELVESYYNIATEGYDIERLDLKTGRLALQTFEDRFYTSQAGSTAITQLHLFGSNDYFPETPLQYDVKTGMKRFHMNLESRYANENNDSIYVVNYRPKSSAKGNFEGRIWINVNRRSIEKITMNCSDCAEYPFQPLFPEDSITGVALNITRTFSGSKKDQRFEHIDFSYGFTYRSRTGKPHTSSYQVTTDAVLYAYDYSTVFEVPHFRFQDGVADYRKINAFPYNSFFWNTHTEFGMNEQEGKNAAYFNDPTSITTIDFFKTVKTDTLKASNLIRKRGFFEHPYIHWSEDRVLLRETLPDQTSMPTTGTITAEQYLISVQLFMDADTYGDSTVIVTDAILDPYETYYHLPIDDRTNCFINLYFDWCEIQRRRLQQQLQTLNTSDPILLRRSYDTFNTNFEKESLAFFKEMDRGTNEKAMQKWNAYVDAQLGMNNLSLFGLNTETKP